MVFIYRWSLEQVPLYMYISAFSVMWHLHIPNFMYSFNSSHVHKEGFTLCKQLVSECYQSLTAHQHQKGHTTAKTGDNDCNINSSRYSLSTALCESIRFQAKSEQNVRQDLIPRVRHGEAALCTPGSYTDKQCL